MTIMPQKFAFCQWVHAAPGAVEFGADLCNSGFRCTAQGWPMRGSGFRCTAQGGRSRRGSGLAHKRLRAVCLRLTPVSSP